MKTAKRNKTKILSAKGITKSAQALNGVKAAFNNKPLSNHALPDPMNSAKKIPGANVFIPQVGISNLKLPFKVRISRHHIAEVCCTFSVYVSLSENKRGINMSRILRQLSSKQQVILDKKSYKNILNALAKDLETKNVFLRAEFEFPYNINSLRSEHKSVQYYKAAFESRLASDGITQFFNELEFQYSSACPCSTELSEHASRQRAVLAIPHSQRSLAKVRVQLADKSEFLLDKLLEYCRKALVTETQMIVRREDEQAFAELNGSNQKFVEDAVRLLFAELDSDRQIEDFSVNCQHFESLHAHNAVASIVKGVRSGMPL